MQNVKFKNSTHRAGFILVELIVAFAIIAILSFLTIASFVSYGNSQALKAASDDLAATLHAAKAKSLSQVKDPTLCIATDALDGYKVVINSDNKTYDLYVVCAGVPHIMNTKSLPANITFTSPTPKSFFFPVLTGGVVGSGTVVVSGYGQTKSITVDSSGNILAI